MLGASAIHYCGSPLQLDFGEEDQAKQVNVVTLEPGLPAKVDAVELRSGRRLRTLTGTLADLEAAALPEAASRDAAEDWLRVRVTEPGRAGLADEVRELLGPGVVDVRVESPSAARPTRERAGRTPRALFADYLAEQGVEDRALEARFVDLLEEAEDADRDPAEPEHPDRSQRSAPAARQDTETKAKTKTEPEPEPEAELDLVAAAEPVQATLDLGPAESGAVR
jgi:exonuclease SbcD